MKLFRRSTRQPPEAQGRTPRSKAPDRGAGSNETQPRPDPQAEPIPDGEHKYVPRSPYRTGNWWGSSLRAIPGAAGMATRGRELFARAAGSTALDNRRHAATRTTMASSLLALLDDIATLLDDVSILTKVAAKKTAGVLGDDLALNAQQVSGVAADRELPVVWAVAKGSALNKAILVPLALAISAFAPWAVVPLLMVGGAFLCFEGFEKLAHRFLHSRHEDEAHHQALTEALVDPQVDLVTVEKGKIKGAIRTDFILSAEIITITLGTVAESDFVTRVAVLVGIAVLMTVGVYWLVGAIVKLDDFGLYLTRRTSAAARAVGAGILRAAPWLMKTLSVAGTAAMFLVGGGILVHGIAPLHHAIEGLAHGAGALGWLVTALLGALVGVAAGALVLAVVVLGKRMFIRNPEPAWMAWIDWLQWPAMLTTVLAAWLVGSTREARRKIGFWVFLASNALWAVWGWHDNAYALVVLQAALAVMNIRGARKNDAAETPR